MGAWSIRGTVASFFFPPLTYSCTLHFGMVQRPLTVQKGRDTFLCGNLAFKFHPSCIVLSSQNVDFETSEGLKSPSIRWKLLNSSFALGKTVQETANFTHASSFPLWWFLSFSAAGGNQPDGNYQQLDPCEKVWLWGVWRPSGRLFGVLRHVRSACSVIELFSQLKVISMCK